MLPLSLLVLFSLTAAASNLLPDVKKMNVSQEEYERMFQVYLRRVREKDFPSSYFSKQFYTFKHSGISEAGEHSRELHFPLNLTSESRVESATLRMLLDARRAGSKEAEVVVYMRRPGGAEAVAGSKRLDLGFLPRWAEVHLEGVQPPLVQLRLGCPGCHLRLLSPPTLNLLVDEEPSRRKRENRGRTDCYPTGKRQRCCRHKMQVVFKDLPGYEFIVQPYSFDAGFCKGTCPYRYNPANHHASLQSLIWRQKKGAAPKPCCAPSKLDQLEIIQLDEKDPTKLKVATWSNMKVTECACF